MKTVVQIIATIVIAAIAGLFLPWWSIAVSAFTAGIIFSEKMFRSFLAGFAGIGLLWFTWALVIDNSTNSILTTKIAEMLSVGSPLVVIFITALVGALVGGCAAATGTSLRKILV